MMGGSADGQGSPSDGEDQRVARMGAISAFARAYGEIRDDCFRTPLPCGEGSGVGVGRWGTSVLHGTPPPPPPPPTGGGPTPLPSPRNTNLGGGGPGRVLP